MQTANRLTQLPPYLFVDIDRKKRAAIDAGRDVIDFGVGDPDQPTPDFIVNRMAEAIRTPAHHRYALGIGMVEFRKAVASYFAKRFDVKLDADREVMALLGSKEGLGHLPTAVVNAGEVVLVPDPGYPVYEGGSIFAGAVCHRMPLRKDTDWLPVLEDIPEEVCQQATLMFLNYPNNPTAAVATMEFYERAVAFARRHEILLAHDAAYSELYFDDPPHSILEINGAKDVCVEFHSLSKTFNMTGWRCAFVVGQPDVLAALAKVKSNLDSGMFGAVQCAGIEALKHIDSDFTRVQREMYRTRRDVLVGALTSHGWTVESPSATFYVWAKCPDGSDSIGTAMRILDEADVVVIPGNGFGSYGEGYVRFALTVPKNRTAQAVERISRLSW